MKKMNFTSQMLRVGSLMMLFLTLGITLAAQCKEKVTVHLNPKTCSYILDLADLRTDAGTNINAFPLKIRKLTTAGAQDYVSGYSNGSYTLGAIIEFGRNDIGTEFELMTGTGANMCFHYVTVADDYAPIAEELNPVYIKCTDLTNGKVPGPNALGSWKGVAGRGQVKNPLPTQIFTASDCSDFTQAWEDEYGPVDPCPSEGCLYQRVIRHWTLKDIFGNTSYYNQVINVYSPKITIPGVLNNAGEYVVDLYNCNIDASAAGAPIVNYGTCGSVGLLNETAVFGKDYCGISITKIEETRMNLCPGSYMLTRKYKVNYCNKFTTITQVVNVWDRTTPLVQFKYNDYLRVKESMCYNMNGMELTEFVYKTVVTPIDLKFGNQQIDGIAPANASYSLKITPLVNSISCNTASISLDYTVSDPTL